MKKRSWLGRRDRQEYCEMNVGGGAALLNMYSFCNFSYSAELTISGRGIVPVAPLWSRHFLLKTN